MQLVQAAIFYLVIGIGVAVAVLLQRGANRAAGTFRAVTAVFFWPIYVPILLASDATPEPKPNRAEPPADAMALAIAQVDAELSAALSTLDGWAENVLDRERDRLGELAVSWRVLADRIREMDRLLERSELDAGGDNESNISNENSRVAQSEKARRLNLERLRAVRRESYQDLMGTLAWVRELVTMIHLAKFTGAPAARAEELVAQIAAAVEGLSEVTHWRGDDEPMAPKQSAKPAPARPLAAAGNTSSPG